MAVPMLVATNLRVLLGNTVEDGNLLCHELVSVRERVVLCVVPFRLIQLGRNLEMVWLQSFL